MEEKIIIKGDFGKNIISYLFFILSSISFVISIIVYLYCGGGGFIESFILPQSAEGIAVLFWLGIVFLAIAIFFIFEMNFCEIVITDKRIYGKTSFGRAINLPCDKISSVGTCYPKGIIVATSSGIIRFWLLSNQTEVFNAITDLLNNRQNKQESVEVHSTDDLKKYKELLDSGIITQEEFDAKKKQLLGL